MFQDLEPLDGVLTVHLEKARISGFCCDRTRDAAWLVRHPRPTATSRGRGQLLRSTAFFDGHGATHSATVLAAWLTLGVVLCLAGNLRRRPTTTVEDRAAQPALHAAV